ncbi:unnamed protein product [Oncorhynchus mykiss]|uniref:Peptidase M14 domain-containing protein n=1 Tax=Oncorhynchus mykiss TaxID=8022 RepID=A0A060WAE1_ONCMY|nr:unnamed protein product [Oncorhynchus mykiss]
MLRLLRKSSLNEALPVLAHGTMWALLHCCASRAMSRRVEAKVEFITDGISHPTQQNPEKVKKLVVLTARVHPGESPASFICQGVIDFLVSQHPVAQTLRDHVIFKIVPMLNPDGVYLGNYRCSLMGFDLNRHWQEPSPWAHPTLHAVKQLIVQLSQDPVSPNLQPATNTCITHFVL